MWVTSPLGEHCLPTDQIPKLFMCYQYHKHWAAPSLQTVTEEALG